MRLEHITHSERQVVVEGDSHVGLRGGIMEFKRLQVYYTLVKY